MNSLESQEKTIYTYLQPFLSAQGYEAVSTGAAATGISTQGLPAPGKEFRKATSGGFKSVLFTFSSEGDRQVLNLHLGVRFNIIESLVSQFLEEDGPVEEQHTLIASPHRFNHPPLPGFLLTDESSLHFACKQIGEFMQKKGFRFLNTFDNLKCVDASINRKPHLPSPYMHNQIHRCFKGIALARLLQRTNFETLCSVYRNYLLEKCGPEKVIVNYNRLVTYLKCFSFN